MAEFFNHVMVAEPGLSLTTLRMKEHGLPHCLFYRKRRIIYLRSCRGAALHFAASINSTYVGKW
jgi:hypothetical protein